MKRRVLVVALALLLAGTAHAGEKKFDYVYEPFTLAPGQIELEQWVNPKFGKAGGVYSQFDLRTEFEVGVIENLQTSLYLNLEATNAKDARAGKRAKGFITDDGESRFDTFEFDTISNEWLWKLLDPTADFVGLALYVEPEFNGHEFEIEEKILIGKVWGDLTAAMNFIFEQDWRSNTDEANRELVFGFTAGVSYHIPDTPLAFGLEFRTEHQLDFYTKYTHAVFSLGPNIHFVRDRFWATLCVMPQLASPTRTYKSFDYDGYEVIEARLIIGIEL